MLLRADEAKVLLESLGFASGKKMKTRPKSELLLINTVELDHHRVAVSGFGSEPFWSALLNRHWQNTRQTKQRENQETNGNQANQVNAENHYAIIYSPIILKSLLHSKIMLIVFPTVDDLRGQVLVLCTA